MKNLLEQSRSAYLRQHKDNPVHWSPWTSEALERARRENKPIFLSIGYSSCHWCHVMEKESFSNPHIAQLLNDNFVCIKVDREERPDLDQLYMRSVQAMTGQGGWPLNVFLTPDLRPFYGGTYFAPDRRYGRPGFPEILERVKEIYSSQQDEVRKSADALTNYLFQSGRYFEPKTKAGSELYPKVLRNLEALYDAENGGFGPAPKFFYTDGLRLFLLAHEQTENSFYLEAVEKSLDRMARGGVYDQVGGGFHRYSTDAYWQIPHYEKMLYDNALLTEVFAQAWAKTQNPYFLYVARRNVEWVRREMRAEEGGYFSSIDADSEGGEGEYYVWKRSDLQTVFSNEELEKFLNVVELSEHGAGPLSLRRALHPEEFEFFNSSFERLDRARQNRSRPGTDTKVQISWNGLWISALCSMSYFTGEREYLEEAMRAADYLWAKAFREGFLRHALFEGEATEEGFLEDQAYFGRALLDLFFESKETRYFEWALELAEGIKTNFYDSQNGGFWTTRETQQDLLLRSKEVQDGALPSPYAIATSLFQTLYLLTGREDFGGMALKSFEAVLGTAEEQPGGFSSLAWVSEQFEQEKVLITPPAWQRSREISKSAFLRVLPTGLSHSALTILNGKSSGEGKLQLCGAQGCQNLSEDESRQLFSNLADRPS